MRTDLTHRFIQSPIVPWLVLSLAFLGAGTWAYGKWRIAHPDHEEPLVLACLRPQ